MKKYKINLLSKNNKTNYTIYCYEDQFILDAAEEQGFTLSYSWRVKACSIPTYLGRIVNGTVD